MTTTLSGSLSEFRLADVLALLAMGGRTARMQITSPAGVGAVDLVDGQVSAATADATRAGLLRQVLGAAPVPADDLAAALHSAHPVLALVESGVVDGALAREVAADHCVDAVGDMLGWEQGEFAVSMGDPRSGDLGVRLGVDQLIADARTRVEEWELVHGMLPESGAVLRLTPDLSMAPMLGVEDWAILARIDGRRTLAEVVAAAGAAQLAASGRLAELMDRGLVQVRTDDADSEREVVATLLDRFEGRVPAAARVAPPSSAMVVEDVVAGAEADPVAEVVEGGEEDELAGAPEDQTAEIAALEEAAVDEAFVEPAPVEPALVEEAPVEPAPVEEAQAPEQVHGQVPEQAAEPGRDLPVELAEQREPVLEHEDHGVDAVASLFDPAPADEEGVPALVPDVELGTAPVWTTADEAPVALEPEPHATPVVALAEPVEVPNTSFAMTASPRVAAAVFEAVALVSEPEPTFGVISSRGEPVGFDDRDEPAVDVVPVFDVAVDHPVADVAWSPWAQALGLGEPSSDPASPVQRHPDADHGQDLLAGPGLGQYLAGASEQATAPVPGVPTASWAAEPPAGTLGMGLPTPREPGELEGAAAPLGAEGTTAEGAPAPVARPAGSEAADLPAGLLSHLIASVRGL